MQIKIWLKALRIKHWIKNFFVVAPFLASYQFGFNVNMLKTVTGFFLFSFLSSAVYLFNDVLDRKSDQLHPVKRLRPIAAGLISVNQALTASLFLTAFALFSASQLNYLFFLCLVAYASNNLLYSFWFKQKTVIDIISIAIGFVLRIYAGGFIVGITVTNWMVACVFCLSLLLGFGKRRTELENLQEAARDTRKVNESYDIPKINLLLGVSASVTIVAYILYSISPETKALHKTDNIILTTPLVIYCIFRYLLKIQEIGRGDGPVEIILRDRAFLAAGFLWVTSFMYFIHS